VDRVHAPEDQNADDVRFAAIAIGIPDRTRPHQLHTGVVYREKPDHIKMLHLQFHHVLMNDAVGEDYFVVEMDFIEERLQAVSALCRRIARKYVNGGIPYGLTPPNDVFDAVTGELLLGPTATGLTCATFVLAIFQAARLPLIDLESWPPADAFDRRWQLWIASMLRKHTRDDAHADAVLSEVGVGRIRPEHVAAAGINANPPVHRSAIEFEANEIAFKVFDRHRNEMLDSHESAMDILHQFLESLFWTYRLTPFAIRFKPPEPTLVRYHHPFRDKDYLSAYLPPASLHLRFLSKLLPKQWIFEKLVQAKIERNGASDDSQAKKQQLKVVLREFLANDE